MLKAIKKGLSFGLTSGVITTLGLMVGLNAGTHSKLVVIGGILSIAVADAFSDAFGIHISEEATKAPTKSIWQSTISTFFFKLIFALTFLVPILLFELSTAIFVSIAWGLFLLALISLKMADEQKKSRIKIIAEHLAIALLVIVATNFLGAWIAASFG